MRLLIPLITFLFCLSAWAIGFNIDKIKVKCDGSPCDTYNSKLKDLKNDYLSQHDFIETFKFVISSMDFANLDYSVVKEKKGNVLYLSLKSKIVINEIRLAPGTPEKFNFVSKLLKREKGTPLSEWDLAKTKEAILSSIKNSGYIYGDVTYTIEKVGKDVDVVFNIENFKSVNIYKINFNLTLEEHRNILSKYFNSEVGKIWQRSRIEEKLDAFIKKVFEQGFYFASYKYSYKYYPKEGLVLDIEINSGKQYSFNFMGSKIFSHQEIREEIKKDIGTSINEINPDDIKRILSKMYKRRGIYNTVFNVRIESTKDKYHKYLFVDIIEGEKLKVSQVNFKGNTGFTNEYLQELYHDKGSTLAQRDFFDSEYVELFASLLKRHYLSNGFILAEVESPVVKFLENNQVEIDFRISEGKQCILKTLAINGLPNDLLPTILKNISNREGQPINLIAIDSDLEMIQVQLKEAGYYFAKIDKSKIKNFLSYNNAYMSAEMKIQVEDLRLVKFRRSVITGYEYTKRKIIKREIRFQKGELVTPSRVTGIFNRLNSLGLFSLIRVTPIIVESTDVDFIDVRVFVKEKDFGVLEVALGFRTDIGLKLSSSINYNNLGGRNRSIGFLAQSNYRFNFSNLDARRKSEQNRFVEFLTKATFIEPYLFPKLLGNNLIFETELSFQKKRFFGFDAEIIRLSPKIAKSVSDYVSLSLGWQFDYINQFDGTKIEDNEIFQIGSINPAITLDFRDRTINTRKGGLMDLSLEFANPSFGSMSDEDIELDYIRAISRNRFYIPIAESFIIATSFSAGYEENFQQDLKYDDTGALLLNSNGQRATKGFIPSINVFRLDGIDNVRGFADNEINILNSGLDISDTVIQGKAYFANFKLEGRYLVNDNFVAGLFYDAGRVFVDHFKPLDLRSSFGMTFKLLTPVGSLDFDYGVKFDRKTLGNNKREAFGRFHLAIGFF